MSIEFTITGITAEGERIELPNSAVVRSRASDLRDFQGVYIRTGREQVIYVTAQWLRALHTAREIVRRNIAARKN